MDMIHIYQCFCDATRLRILHLLTQGPLCVCHFQQVLELPQTKVSQHLSYLRKRGMVECTRHANWVIYHLPEQQPVELELNLRCLQDCAAEDARFRADLGRLAAVQGDCRWIEGALSGKKLCNC